MVRNRLREKHPGSPSWGSKRGTNSPIYVKHLLVLRNRYQSKQTGYTKMGNNPGTEKEINGDV
uniref:Uncharacterized protein n=1 Tax=Arion vulgaris TaxID=1028688 RepID=A0A0B7AMH4_9EUPU